MKFSSTLQFNAVPEWRDHYIDYDHLKELIFKLERANVPALQEESDSLAGVDAEKKFGKAIDKDANKVNEFFASIEQNIFADHSELMHKLDVYLEAEPYSDSVHPVRSFRDSVRQQQQQQQDSEAQLGDQSSRSGSGSSSGGGAGKSPSKSSKQNHKNKSNAQQSDSALAETNDESDSSDDENAQPALRRKSTIHEELVQKRSIPFENVSLRREITRCYMQLNELLSYIDLNREGLRKALKKFDKVTGTTLLPVKMRELKSQKVFADQTTTEIGHRCDKLVEAFANLTGESERESGEKLQGMLREHVVYERNTVWRELIGLERQQQGVQQDQSQPGKIGFLRKVQLCGKVVYLPKNLVPLVVATLFFLVILLFQPLEVPVQSRCLAIVVLASLLWATEALPLFVTSLLVPMLVVILQIPLNDEGEAMSPIEASAFVFAKMWSPVITVLLGGFTLAAALSKYSLAKALAQFILKRVGTEKPQVVMLTLMLVAAFLCMWISNVAAPVLLFSVAQPLLRLLPSSDPLTKGLILGIALASNVGGMASPIASPQNILALQNMDPVPSWVEWFVVSLPVSLLSIVGIWLWLCLSTPITREAREVMQHVNTHNSAAGLEFKAVHYFILITTVVTILLWCFSHQLEPIVGDMGVLALVPIVLLFGSNVLSGADFNNFLWTIVALAMGGIVLGKSVESCGLLATVATSIQSKVSTFPLFAIVIIFGLMILVVASFISHTVAALIILPLVKSIGEHMDDPHPRLIVMLSALLCSAAMALPTSGFPNVTAVCMVDELGNPYLSAADFISRGVPSSVIVYVVVITVGYLLCKILGF